MNVSDSWTLLMRATPSRHVRIRLLQWLTPCLPLVILATFVLMPEAERSQDFGAGHWQITGPLLITALASLLPLSLWGALLGAYVLEIAVDADHKRARITVLRAFGSAVHEDEIRRFLPGEAVVGARGRIQTPVFHLVAPNGRRLMLDLQSDFPLGMPEAFRILGISGFRH